jgi:hypothetical protein
MAGAQVPLEHTKGGTAVGVVGASSPHCRRFGADPHPIHRPTGVITHRRGRRVRAAATDGLPKVPPAPARASRRDAAPVQPLRAVAVPLPGALARVSRRRVQAPCLRRVRRGGVVPRFRRGRGGRRADARTHVHAAGECPAFVSEDCDKPIVCFVCDTCDEHCRTEGGPHACSKAHEAWRLGKGHPTFGEGVTVTHAPRGRVPPAPKPRWRS